MLTNYGILSLVPILFVLVTAIWTRKAIEPLILGAALSFLLSDGIGFIGGIVDGVYIVFRGDTLAMIVSITILFGIFVELLEKSKAANAFSLAIASKVKSDKGSLFAAWGMGIVLFIDDFLNAIVVGTTMRKVTTRYRVPRAMLAYVVDVTAGPMAVILPFSAWAVFFMSMFSELELTTLLGLTTFQIYWRTVPFMLYSIVAILLVPFVIMRVIPPLGPMKKAYQQMEQTVIPVDLAEDEIGSARPYHFIIPIFILVFFTFVLGGDVVQSTILALIVTLILFRAQRLLTSNEVADCLKNGVIKMLPVIGIIFFSLLLVEGNVRLGTTQFIIKCVAPLISGQMLPAITFATVCVMAFTTGSFFGTSAIVLPTIVALAISNDSNIFMALGAVVSGAVFGSHCCFFGDATVLTATSCEISPLDHALTQLPYGLISWAIAFVAYVVLGHVL